MNWFSSGIKNEFRYEMLDPFLDTSYGDLEVYSCEISEGYYTDAKAQATITCNGDEYIENAAVRVWHSATLGDESLSECIGTFICDTCSQELTNGANILTLNLMHPLDKMATDYRCGDASVAASGEAGAETIAAWVSARIEGSGCKANISPELIASGRKFASPWVWEHGESTLAAIQSAADACTYQVGADVYGNVTFYPYQSPSAKTVSFEFPEGELSITEPSVKVSSGDIVNQVNVKATQDQETLTARATVAATHPWHKNKIGRWYAKNYEESQLSPFTQQALQAKADYYLSINDTTTRKWEATCLYVPIQCGDVVRFRTGDGAAEVIAMVQQKKINCDATMEMSLVLDEVI